MNGIRTAKMEIKSNIPSTIRIAGHTVSFIYSGQKRTRYKCGSQDHLIEHCTLERTLNEDLNDKEQQFPQLGKRAGATGKPKENQDQSKGNEEQPKEKENECKKNDVFEENEQSKENGKESKENEDKCKENGKQSKENEDQCKENEVNSEHQSGEEEQILNDNGKEDHDARNTNIDVINVDDGNRGDDMEGIHPATPKNYEEKELDEHVENAYMTGICGTEKENSEKSSDEEVVTVVDIHRVQESTQLSTMTDETTMEISKENVEISNLDMDLPNKKNARRKDTAAGYNDGMDTATGHDENFDMTDDSLEKEMINEAEEIENLIKEYNWEEEQTEARTTGKWKVHMENDIKLVLKKNKDSEDKTRYDEETVKGARERKRLKVDGNNA